MFIPTPQPLIIHHRSVAINNGTKTTTTHHISPTSTSSSSCITLKPNQLLISRPTFIITLTLCIFTTVSSLLILSIILYRQHIRKKEITSWGRQSRYHKHVASQDNSKRVSMIRKEIDDEYSRNFRGVFLNPVVENPEMGSDSPVEIAGREERVWEVDAVGTTPKVNKNGGAWEVSAGTPQRAKNGGAWEGTPKRETMMGRMSLFFDERVGVWMPRR